MATRVGEGGTKRGPDHVIVEEPLEIRLDGELVTVTMRTPGNDFELAVGFCHGEGLLEGHSVHDIRYCATGSAVATEFNVVTVSTSHGTAGDGAVARLSTTTSSCGLCGSATIEAVTERLRPQPAAAPADPAILTRVAAEATGAQPLFQRTGAVHAAIAFDLATGDAVIAREDIGRHNAADKVVGRLVLDGQLPATTMGLFLSGRVSLEMVQKAWAAGFSLVVSVGGPSSLAITAAQAANMTLVGYLRGDSMNVYAGPVP